MNRDSVEAWLKEYGVENYTINEDLSVDVDGDVNLWSKDLLEIPIKFGRVSGYFSCSSNHLSSLVGCPISVGGDFYGYSNCLTILEGCPESVGGDFDCKMNDLKEEEWFLYNCTPEQIGLYYKNKKLIRLKITQLMKI